MFLHGPLDRRKKNVLPDYCTDDVPNGFSSQMNNMLSRIVDWIPSGLRLTSRAEIEASTVSKFGSGRTSLRLQKSLKGVCVWLKSAATASS